MTALASMLAGGGIWALFGQRLQQPAINMQAVSGASLALVNELQEELKTAREITAKVASLEASVSALEVRVATLLGWIHAPDMDLALLRRLAPIPPTFNGRS